jgi:hypothetical protein
MLSVNYAECLKKPIMLNAITLSVIMLNLVKLSVVAPNEQLCFNINFKLNSYIFRHLMALRALFSRGNFQKDPYQNLAVMFERFFETKTLSLDQISFIFISFMNKSLALREYRSYLFSTNCKKNQQQEVVQVSMLKHVFVLMQTMKKPNKLEGLHLTIIFQTSLTFAGNTRSLPQKEPSERSSNGICSGLALNFKDPTGRGFQGQALKLFGLRHQ